MHRSWIVSRAEQLYNTIEAARLSKINAALSDASFVAQHFPRHEFAARAETGRLMARQNLLIDRYTA